MITAAFAIDGSGAIRWARISGHAGYAPAGEDIVCAAVSSAVQLTANALTEILHTGAAVDISENSVRLQPATGDEGPQQFLLALRPHLLLLADDYPGTVQVTISEV